MRNPTPLLVREHETPAQYCLYIKSRAKKPGQVSETVKIQFNSITDVARTPLHSNPSVTRKFSEEVRLAATTQPIPVASCATDDEIAPTTNRLGGDEAGE